MRAFLLTLTLMTTSAHALSLLDHAAFASKTIQGACYDFQGPVAAGGDIHLQDSRIRVTGQSADCPLRSGGELKFQRGSVERMGSKACVESRKLRLDQAIIGTSQRPSSDAGVLTNEMYRMSTELLRKTPANVVKSVLTQENFVPGTTLTLVGQKNKLLVLEVRGQKIVMTNINIRLTGGASPNSIAWVFPDATEVLVDRSGVNPLYDVNRLGMPGTFLAPWARFTFLNSRMTGGLYAHEILSSIGQTRCTQQRQGLIGHSHLRPIKKS